MTSRRRKVLMAVAAGFALGLTGYRLLTRDPDRAARMLALFEEHCVPFVTDGVTPKPVGLTSISAVPHEQTWMDEQTALTLSADASGCAVSDMFRPMSAEDQTTVEAGFADLRARRFPDWVSVGDELPEWELHLAWVPHGEPSPGRAILISRPGPAAGDPATMLRAGMEPR